jgi:hypothetical protein
MVGDQYYQMMPHAFLVSQSTVERLIVYMDAHSIDKAVIMQEFMDGNQDKYLAEAKQKYPDRLFVLSLMPVDVTDNLNEYLSSIEALDMQGIMYYSFRTLKKNYDSKIKEVISRALKQWKGEHIYIATKVQPTVWPKPAEDNPSIMDFIMPSM